MTLLPPLNTERQFSLKWRGCTLLWLSSKGSKVRKTWCCTSVPTQNSSVVTRICLSSFSSVFTSRSGAVMHSIVKGSSGNAPPGASGSIPTISCTPAIQLSTPSTRPCGKLRDWKSWEPKSEAFRPRSSTPVPRSSTPQSTRASFATSLRSVPASRNQTCFRASPDDDRFWCFGSRIRFTRSRADLDVATAEGPVKISNNLLLLLQTGTSPCCSSRSISRPRLSTKGQSAVRINTRITPAAQVSALKSYPWEFRGNP
mmetsp:Transcript_14736/g.32506  ORF Transcript_14736/g.32506 Transcript_14736/m.32506 type:complete len:257 (-) Transcript_14736:191-961(-)